MMKLASSLGYATLFLFLTNPPCYLNQEQQESYEKTDEIILVEDTKVKNENLYSTYLKATYHYAKKDFAQAASFFEKVLSQKHPIYIYEGFMRFLHDSGQQQHLAKLVEKKGNELEKAFAKNLDIQMILAQTYLTMGNDEKAHDMFKILSINNADNHHIAYHTIIHYVQNNQLDKAHNLIKESLAKQELKSKAFLFYFLQSKVYLMEHKHNEALKSIEHSLALFPGFERGWLFKAMLMEQVGKVKEAISGYKKFLDIVGHDPMVEKQLVSLLFMQEEYDQAADYLKTIKSDDPEYFHDLALIEFKAKQYEKALEHINSALNKNSSFKQAQVLKLELLLQLKKTNDALSFMEEWLSDEPKNVMVIHTFMLLRKTPIKREKLFAVLDNLVKKHPQSIHLLAALADLAYDIGKKNISLNCYQKMVPLVTEPNTQSLLLFHIGYTLFSMKQYDNVEKTLRKALALTPTQPSANNLLAYYYALTNQKLDEALHLVDTALAQEPLEAHFLDTKGYILFKAGKNEEAREAYQQALKISPNDSIIKQHLTQVHHGTKK